jgi:hypothetical protein
MKLKKVKGELNPADLLTKHMPSREKLTQLVELFGCSFVDGRAASAPLLRKRKPEEMKGAFDEDDIVEVIEDSDLNGKIYMLDAKSHDLSRWPHLYPAGEQEILFPTVIAAPEIEDVSPEEFALHKTLHERWATRRPTRSKVTLKEQ